MGLVVEWRSGQGHTRIRQKVGKNSPGHTIRLKPKAIPSHKAQEKEKRGPRAVRSGAAECRRRGRGAGHTRPVRGCLKVVARVPRRQK